MMQIYKKHFHNQNGNSFVSLIVATAISLFLLMLYTKQFSTVFKTSKYYTAIFEQAEVIELIRMTTDCQKTDLANLICPDNINLKDASNNILVSSIFQPTKFSKNWEIRARCTSQYDGIIVEGRMVHEYNPSLTVETFIPQEEGFCKNINTYEDGVNRVYGTTGLLQSDGTTINSSYTFPSSNAVNNCFMGWKRDRGANEAYTDYHSAPFYDRLFKVELQCPPGFLLLAGGGLSSGGLDPAVHNNLGGGSLVSMSVDIVNNRFTTYACGSAGSGWVPGPADIHCVRRGHEGRFEFTSFFYGQ